MMQNNFNPMQLMQFLKSSGNPQQFVMNMIEESTRGNPLFLNLLALAKNGNTEKIESIARNIMQERGLDFDKEFNSFKRTMGL